MNSSQQQSNFLNPNIFLNTSSSSTTQAAPQQQQQQQSLSSTAPVAVPIIQQPLSHQSVNSPIVSTPGSPGNTNSLAADSLAVNQVPPSSNMSVQRWWDSLFYIFVRCFEVFNLMRFFLSEISILTAVCYYLYLKLLLYVTLTGCL